MAPVTPTATNPNLDFLEVLLTTSRLVISSGMFFQWITNSEYVKLHYTTEFLNFLDVSFLIYIEFLNLIIYSKYTIKIDPKKIKAQSIDTEV